MAKGPSDEEKFEMLVRAALAGEVCPPHITLAGLANAGRIRVEKYAAGNVYDCLKNCRVVTILEGEHADISTHRPAWIIPQQMPYGVLDIRDTDILRELGLVPPADIRPVSKRSRIQLEIPDWENMKK
jgi:hypothetical protein